MEGRAVKEPVEEAPQQEVVPEVPAGGSAADR